MLLISVATLQVSWIQTLLLPFIISITTQSLVKLLSLETIPDEEDNDTIVEKLEEMTIENNSINTRTSDSSPFSPIKGTEIDNEHSDEQMKIEELRKIVHGDERLRKYSNSEYTSETMKQQKDPSYKENSVFKDYLMDQVISYSSFLYKFTL